MINDNLMQMDLSVLGICQHADIVVKVVMMGLLLASVGTWAVFLGKYAELTAAKRYLKRAQRALQNIGCLNDAAQAAKQFPKASHVAGLIAEALDERALSGASDDTTGLKERTGFRLERRVASIGRHAARGNGLLATVGSVAPFIGLFGTVWGIMNSFIGIAKTQTTNLAVVAPGIAEALLATAVGLLAAIPAVVIYNLFVRMIAGYQASLGDTAAQILLLQSRDADTGQQAAKSVVSAAQHIRVG